MPVAQQDQWQRDESPQEQAASDSAAIARLEAALSRIAVAAGRQQDQLRISELTAQTAQYELETLLRDRAAAPTSEVLQVPALGARLDALIAEVQAALGDGLQPASPATDTNPD